jgi:phage FluMu gp28-like protein
MSQWLNRTIKTMPRKKTQIAKKGPEAEEPKGTRRKEREAGATREDAGCSGALRAPAPPGENPAVPSFLRAGSDRRYSKERDVRATGETTPHPVPPSGTTLSPRRGLDHESPSRAEVVSHPIRLLPYQKRWVEDRSPLKLVVKARQIGYSFSATLQALLRCLERKTTWIFLSKGERQSKLLMEKVQEHIQSCGIVAQAFESTFFEGASQKQLEVRLPNGSVIYGLPSNPDTARGYSGNVTLDEFAFHADAAKIYSALFPTITRGYSLEVISTPNGQQGKFYELAKAAGLTEFAIGDLRLVNEKSPITNYQSSMVQWSGHWCDVYEAVRQGLKINIELLRSGCDDESTFQQEFCCQFVSTAENFFPPELLAACLSAEARTDTPAHHLASARGIDQSGSGGRRLDGTVGEPATTGQGLNQIVFSGSDSEFFMGIDIGRQHDRTVFWLDELIAAGGGGEGAGAVPAPSEERLAIARMVRTLDRAPFAGQLECARELLRLERQDGQPLVRRAAIDATGIGAMLAETLADEFGPRVEPVTFTAAVKENLAYRTRRRMEKQLSLLPDTREVRRAFSAVKKIVTPSGNLRFDAVRTAAGHADEFWAKALADLAAESEPASTAAAAYLAGGTPIINPRAFREIAGGWGQAF